MLKRFDQAAEWIVYLFLWFLLITASSPQPGNNIDRARAFTRPVEFNYDAWTTDAVLLKLGQSALGLPSYASHEARQQAVTEYLRLTQTALQAEGRLNVIFADPAIKDKESASSQIVAQLDAIYARQKQIQPLAESVIQSQVSDVLAGQGLTLGGQPLPPVLYHVSPLPLNLVISRRDKIEQIAAISLQPDLNVEQQVKLEDEVAAELDASTLVVPVGGIGVYPTMVMRTDNFTWQVGTVAHEWTHNFLTLRPLGFLYDTSPELRTMNETTADIVENEIGPIILKRFYPQLAASSLDASKGSELRLGLAAWVPRPAKSAQSLDAAPPPFDFNSEMHITRVHADELLAEGEIQEAEAYMEQRRQVFWQNGYAIRKLNQAYFAFYGAYADVPGGAAGEDPVGPAVRALRAQSTSLADFLNRISWMTSFQELQTAVQQGPVIQATPTP